MTRREPRANKSLPTSFKYGYDEDATDVADDSSHAVVVQRECCEGEARAPRVLSLGVYFLKTRAVLAARWMRAELRLTEGSVLLASPQPNPSVTTP